MALIFDTVEIGTNYTSGSSNNGRFIGDAWGTKHQTSNGYILLGPANSSHAHIYTDRESFYLNKAMYVTGGTLLNPSDIRSSVFYDVDNTGYYINPASTSNLNALNVAGNPVLTEGTTLYLPLNSRLQGNASTITSSSVTIWDVSEATDDPSGAADGLLTTLYWDSSNWAVQQYHDFHTNDLYLRSKQSGTWMTTWDKVWTAGNDGSGSGLDADLLDGYGTLSNQNWFGGIPIVYTDGVLEIGRYIDFHETDTDTSDFSIRLDATSSRLNISGGFLQNTESMRSPIFFDTDNTAYHANPAGRSELNATNISFNNAAALSSGTFNVSKSINGGIHFTNGSGTGTTNGYQASITFMGSNSGESQAGMYVHNNNSAGTFMAFATTNSYSNGPQIGLRIDNNGKVFADRNFIQSNTDMRAPIFYDSNDTNYYTNPAATSVMNNINIADGIYHVDDTNTYIQFHANDQWRVVTSGAERLEVNNTNTTLQTNLVMQSGFIRGNGQELVLNAGESHGVATGQTGENVYVNAENGLQVNSSPDNWSSGWAGRYTATINDAAGNSYFPGRVQAGEFYTAGKVIHTGDTDTYTEFNAADTWRVVVGGSQKVVVNSSGLNVYGDSNLGNSNDDDTTIAGRLLNTYTGTGIHTLQNASTNGTVLQLTSTGDSRQLYLQTDHVYSNGNLYIGDNSYQTLIRGSHFYFENAPVTFKQGQVFFGEYDNTNGGRLYINGTTVNKRATIQCTNGNLHIDSEDGSSLYLNYYEGSTSNVIFGTGNGGQAAQVNSDGSARFPIYYDYNNTNYYVNPDSSGRSIYINGHITTGIGNGGGVEIGNGGCNITAVGNGDIILQGNTQLRFGPDNYDWNQWGGIKYTGGTSPVLYIGGPSSGQFTSNANPPNTVVTFDGTSYVNTASSFRAPIFYDSNNTAYYTNPASTSVLNQIDFVPTAGYSSSISGYFNALQIRVASGAGVQIGGSGTGWIQNDLTVGNGSLTVSNDVYVGSAIYHQGDTNTYINFNAADDFQIVAGGRQILRMDEGTDPDKLRFTEDNSWNKSDGTWRFHSYVGFGIDPDTASNSGGNVTIQGGVQGKTGLRVIGGGYSSAMSVESPTYGSGIAFKHTGSFTSNAMSMTYGTTNVGSITVSSTSTAYNTSSDYRLKENLTPITDGIERVKLLQPKRFNFIGDDKVVDGFVAHEAQEVVPESVTGEKDAIGWDGNPEYQGIDQGKLIPLLTAALQEAIAKIESLEARVQTLEGQ